MNIRTPRIIDGVPGPSGEPGVLLLVPQSEALDWDLKDEVASTSRYWMADRQAWWVAKPYASTAASIVLRVYGTRPIVEAGEEAPTGEGTVGQPPRSGWLRRLLRRWLSRVRRALAGGGAGRGAKPMLPPPPPR